MLEKNHRLFVVPTNEEQKRSIEDFTHSGDRFRLPPPPTSPIISPAGAAEIPLRMKWWAWHVLTLAQKKWDLWSTYKKNRSGKVERGYPSPIPGEAFCVRFENCTTVPRFVPNFLKYTKYMMNYKRSYLYVLKSGVIDVETEHHMRHRWSCCTHWSGDPSPIFSKWLSQPYVNKKNVRWVAFSTQSRLNIGVCFTGEGGDYDGLTESSRFSDKRNSPI